MTEKMRKVLELLKNEGGTATHYFIVQMCDLYFDDEDTLWCMRRDGYINVVTTKRKSTYSITPEGELAIAPPQPTHEVTVWLSEVLEQIEQAGAWDDGAALRSVIIGEYGLAGLQQIEAYGRRIPVVDTWPGDVWIKAGPWSTIREAKKRNDEIRVKYKG